MWVSSMTFAGGVFPINYLGAKPRFFDLDSDSWCININILADELKNASAKKRLQRQSFRQTCMVRQ